MKDAAGGRRAGDGEPEARVEPRNEAGRVLVVGDEFVIAVEVENVLRRAGYEVVGRAATPEDAARLATEEPLDIELRGGRVFPAADALAHRSVPFVFLTGYTPVMLPAGNVSVRNPCLGARHGLAPCRR